MYFYLEEKKIGGKFLEISLPFVDINKLMLQTTFYLDLW